MQTSPISLQPVPVVPFQPAWVFWIFLGMFTLLAWVQFQHSQRFQLVMKAMFSKRHFNQLVREGNLLNERISLSLSLIYVMSVAMLIFQILHLIFQRTGESIPEFRLFLLLCLAVTGFWALKLLLMNFLSVIFKTERTNSEYKLNILVTVSFLGVLLLPSLLFAVYLRSVWLLYVCLVFIGAFSLFRWVKGFFIGISMTKFSYFFLFVYLCTLELLPLLITSKLILDYF